MATPIPTRAAPALLRSITSSSAAVAAIPALSAEEKADRLPSTSHPILNLDEPDRRPFSSVPTAKLFRSYLNLQLVSLDPAVDLGVRLVRSGLMERNATFRRVMLGVLKETVYDHFCAGEGLEEARKTVEGLRKEGLRGILDYGLEDAVDNEGCDRNLVGFLRTVQMASLLPADSVSFGCVKISAICPISLLERVSDLLRWEQKDPSLHLPWKEDTFPVLAKSSPLYHTTARPDPLTPGEEHDLQSARQRLSKLCQKCQEASLPLLVDAEYTSIQPAIDYITYSAAVQFNKDDNRPIVYGTIQAYLRDAKERLVETTEAAERMGVPMGFKLVRGAYISRESQLASSLGVASPIHASIHETHACYNECASLMLEKIAKGCGSIVLATHNLDSGKVLAAKAEELRIKGSQKLQFAQLMGMADGLSYGLRDAGFCVSKYLPFGPVDQVISYLLRRAEENKGLLSSSSLDRRLMRTELNARLKAAILGGNSEKMMTKANI